VAEPTVAPSSHNGQSVRSINILRSAAVAVFLSAIAIAVPLALQQGPTLFAGVECFASPCMGIGRPSLGWAWFVFLLGAALAGFLWALASTQRVKRFGWRASDRVSP
jgi:hypothetical protein